RVRLNGLELPVTASFGVAATEHRRHCDAESLIRAADAALYRAKAAGRDRVCVARSGDWLAPPPSSRVAPNSYGCTPAQPRGRRLSRSAPKPPAEGRRAPRNSEEAGSRPGTVGPSGRPACAG